MIDGIPVFRIGKCAIKHFRQGLTLYIHIHFYTVKSGAIVVKMVAGLCFQFVYKPACRKVFEIPVHNRPFTLGGKKKIV